MEIMRAALPVLQRDCEDQMGVLLGLCKTVEGVIMLCSGVWAGSGLQYSLRHFQPWKQAMPMHFSGPALKVEVVSSGKTLKLHQGQTVKEL